MISVMTVPLIHHPADATEMNDINAYVLCNIMILIVCFENNELFSLERELAISKLDKNSFAKACFRFCTYISKMERLVLFFFGCI